MPGAKERCWAKVDMAIKLLLFVLICSRFCSMVVAQAMVEPADRQIALAGILTLVNAYGPPGYGLLESTKRQDLKIRYWALELPFEINLACVPDKPDLADIQCGPTKRPRLFFSAQPDGVESKARKLLKKAVTVTGTLHRRTVMAEITPVYMTVVDISPALRK